MRIGLASMWFLCVSCLFLGPGCSPSPEPEPQEERVEARQPVEQAAAEAQVVRLGTAPPGGAFSIVGQAMAEVMDVAMPWEVSAVATKGSLQNIEKLNAGELEFALANAATTFFAADEGHPVRAVMTLAPNVAMFVTRADSNVERVSDLTGKRVMIGPRGAGFEFFLTPIFFAHDAAFTGVTTVYGSQSEGVEMLRRGEVDAAFLGGAVPTESIVRATESMDVKFIPYDELPAKVLKQEFVFYSDATVPAGTYKGLEEDFQALNVGSMHLIAAANLSEEAVYLATKALYENRHQVAEAHPAGNAINPSNVVRDTGTPFHEGAIRYYREIGIWKEELTR